MGSRARAPYAWGMRPGELDAPSPCDAQPGTWDAALFRAIDIDAPPEVTFRWLCQLRVAPYSYDWIDNGGRRSPPALTPGLEQLEVGQRVMSIFELVDFEAPRHLTLRLRRPRAIAVFGPLVCSYVVTERPDGRSRLLAKLLIQWPRKLPWSAMRHVLPWGDLIMMRKQLRTLRHHAESTAARATRVSRQLR
jgi:hypothetical protein